MSLGPLIHLLRPKSGTAHPLRNIVHVALGLFILGFSFFEVRGIFLTYMSLKVADVLNAKGENRYNARLGARCRYPKDFEHILYTMGDCKREALSLS